MNQRPSTITTVLPGLLLAMLLGALDQTIMAPALSSIARDLGDLADMPAVMTAYLAAATAAMPVYGKLGDRFGRGVVIQVALVLFVLGALLCPLATSVPQLAAFRVLQGLGGGGLSIGAQAILGELVSPRERGRYLGQMGAAYVVAAVGGPLIGGLITDHFGWRWIFAIYPPLGLLAAAVLARTLRLPRPRPGAAPPVDYLGAAALAGTVAALVLYGQTGSPVALLVALAAAAAWLVSARHAADPVLPLRLFRDRSFTVPVAVSFLVGFALFGTVTYVPAWAGLAMGVPASQAALMLTGLMAGVLLTTVASGRMITRTGRYLVYPITGTALAAIGLALASWLLATDTEPRILVAATLVLIGLGIGCVVQVMVLIAQNGAEHADLGTATSAVTFFRQIGASLGVAVVGALISRHVALQGAATSDGGQAMGHALALAFGAVAPVLVVACVLTLTLPARPLRTTAHVDDLVEER
ncbi:MAG: MFS transporter [Streptosporangiales bacterium]|nr:MFS transporter [Streptosporangiales bacterium]